MALDKVKQFRTSSPLQGPKSQKGHMGKEKKKKSKRNAPLSREKKSKEASRAPLDPSEPARKNGVDTRVDD